MFAIKAGWRSEVATIASVARDTPLPTTRFTNKLLGIRNKTLFKAPKDRKILTQWVKAIPRSDRNLRSGIDCVCEKHFAETSLIKYFETKMADGSIQKIERGRILLKENSVPSLFPDLPHYLSSKTKKKKTSSLTFKY
ncbi:hypothetical protein QTP88_013222 [Uroleucon formosanum]